MAKKNAFKLIGRTLLWIPVVITFDDLVLSVRACEGRSMQPLLNPGDSNDVLLLDKISLQFVDPKCGDLVRLRYFLRILP